MSENELDRIMCAGIGPLAPPSFDEQQGRAEWEPRLRQALIAKESAKAQAESFLRRALEAEECCAAVLRHYEQVVDPARWPDDRLWDRLVRAAEHVGDL